jgi:hypothetical protein
VCLSPSTSVQIAALLVAGSSITDAVREVGGSRRAVTNWRTRAWSRDPRDARCVRLVQMTMRGKLAAAEIAQRPVALVPLDACPLSLPSTRCCRGPQKARHQRMNSSATPGGFAARFCIAIVVVLEFVDDEVARDQDGLVDSSPRDSPRATTAADAPCLCTPESFSRMEYL